MTPEKYKYNVINKDGLEESWTGIFANFELSEKWYNNHGKWFESRGYNLVLVRLNESEKDVMPIK